MHLVDFSQVKLVINQEVWVAILVIKTSIILLRCGSHPPPWGLSTLAKEFSATARIMQSSSNELSNLVADNECCCCCCCYIIPYNSLAIMVHLLAEQSDTKSNVKLGEFQSRLQLSNVSSHTEELWYNETVCLWMTIYIYIYIYIRDICKIRRLQYGEFIEIIRALSSDICQATAIRSHLKTM